MQTNITTRYKLSFSQVAAAQLSSLSAILQNVCQINLKIILSKINDNNKLELNNVCIFKVILILYTFNYI